MQSPGGRNEDIWVIDVARGTHTRLTSDPATEVLPVWTPDGTRIAFSGSGGLYWMAANGSGGAEALTTSTTNGPLNFRRMGAGLRIRRMKRDR